MKKMLVLLCAMAFLGISHQCKADVFFDDFNDGNADGWTAVTADAPGSSVGDWRVEDGMVKEYSSEGDYKFLRNDLNVGSQIVESKVFSNSIAGWGGVTLWYADFNNWVDVFMYPGYGQLRVAENIGGIPQTYVHSLTTNTDTWYSLKVDADDSTGELKIYLDNEYILTHTVATTHRTGRSGFTTGNNGANFDDFRVNWNNLISPLSKDECKKEGWKLFNNPTFKNQGNCVSYMEKNK
jgi:hypothetical protein